MMNNKPFAEIIESSLQGFLAQSWRWDNFPSFGSLMMVEQKQRTIFGIVHQVQTGSMDPMRYPFPYQKTEEELLQEQPQIFEFLKTTFSCMTIGYQEEGHISYVIAPQPPKIHAFVQSIDSDLCKQFFAHENYLYVLFNCAQSIFNLDELLLALLKLQVQLHILTQAKLEQFIHTYALLIGSDYRRIRLFLQRAQPIVQTLITA